MTATTMDEPQTRTDDDQLLRDWEAAKVLGISKTQMWNLMHSHTLPGVVRIGRSIRISRNALMGWIRTQVGETHHDAG